MYYNKLSRRYFLQGLASSLALPFLPSIMSAQRAYGAAVPPPRFIQIMNAHGQFSGDFFTSDTQLSALPNSGIFAKPLSAVSGDFSKIIGQAFNPYRNKMSVLRGLSVMTGANPNHNSTLGSCASGPIEDNNEQSKPLFPYSVDSVLSESAKIYPNPVGMQRHVNFSPGTERYGNFSWNKINGAIQQMPSTRNTSALLAKFVVFNGSTNQPADPKQVRNANILQSVFADYKSVRDSSKISTGDKHRLEAYMSQIDQVQKGLQTLGPVCTSKPIAEQEVDVDAMTRNQINVLVAAMACQVTRVGSIALSIPYDPFHGYVHSDGLNQAGFAAKQVVLGQHVAYLMSKMDQINEGSGTMLDNSIVYWGNEYGENATSVATGDNAHSSANMPVVVAGGAAGALQMGYYIDYRQTGGMPMNNLLVSFLNAMGLSSSDYERDGTIGFGEYNAQASKNFGFDSYLSSSAKRSGLPFFYKGATMT